jgi:hypothetical protein
MEQTMTLRSKLVRLASTCIVAIAAIAQHGCRDTPTAPDWQNRTNAAQAVNVPGDSGAPEIIFLAPLGPKRHPRGQLDTTLAPAVSICVLSGDECGADTVARFSSDSSAAAAQRVTLGERAYSIRWDVRRLSADPTVAYRVVVTLGDTTVGFTDVKIVAPDYVVPPEDTARFGFITERNAVNIRFQIFVPPVTLTVIVEPGVSGDLRSQTYSFRRGERVMYNFAADSGYRNALVTLDQKPIPGRGWLTMDDSHVLIASADRESGVAPGDEWILHDARALLRAPDKVKSAQRLLTKLSEMSDTTNVAERLRRVEMTLLLRESDAQAMPALDVALDGHSFLAGEGDGSRTDPPDTGGGGGGIITASSLLVPTGGATGARLRPSPSVMAPGQFVAEPVTIAYVNGILTTPLGALFAAHHVARAARDAQWNANAPFDVKLMYNRSAMADAATAEDRCILGLGIKGDWLGLNSLPGEVARCLNSTAPQALAMLADYAEVGQEFVSVLNRSIASRPRDVDSVAAFTTRLRDQGRHVVFVMHSQGNLIVQQALTLLAERGQYLQSRDTTCIGAVSLAAPTSEQWPVAARHLSGLAVEGDVILMLGRNRFPRVRTPMSDSAAMATTGSVRARIMGLATAASIRWRLRLHGAVDSYLTPEPIRTRVQEAITSTYRGCALGTVTVSPRGLTLRTHEVGTLHAVLTDMNGESLDGRRGLSWHADSQSDWQRAVELSETGVVTARYVGGTSVSARTRSVVGSGGVLVDPARLNVSVSEALTAYWAVVFMGESRTEPDAGFDVPAVGWDGGSCTEKATFESHGRVGTFSKACNADYHATSSAFPGAFSYAANFFPINATASLFTVTGRTETLRGTVGGPVPTLDMLPGPALLDRVLMSAYDGMGHLLAQGVGCAHGCAGWPPEN